ncbi:MAG: Tetratricopeptide TPR_1 repeat-containing protein [Candidatus Woesebacteria bacterium GW2011_GWC2_47_16]|uniref:Peptidase C39-like domain-containing protein n=4 Tax=Candidatus Woeseibacteriota TaxID=1752722 RepID=A0A1F8D7N6_9BACT|nr:MAG: Tetratricopeptide TPR_1 repeat-containing protein [Candidatus Woesebacteria bacterium GW2011_GWE1_45_18]KKU25024.1 MAG: Tetratricopeptide TPR_1 repeat-containing protein [Candidatus Woesebacteria bacterium GW2011_GWF1_46_13]KKU65299.1 MAG: Tetratricopeptide TPR_1 repeat-containing protein [Candidatus Woesebacteria bacterium GW2011_GWC2_47_16]OGM84366.1 MAG: hypothetical protein A2376_01730 [Candidatus Woesebacteria bacterium RIFOXYB1_FULL_47_31]
MRKIFIALLALAALGAIGLFLYQNRPRPPVETKFVGSQREELIPTRVGLVTPGASALVTLPEHTYQTFNNCGPATLSMILRFAGKNVSQKELGDFMRPYQIPSGDNDDKTIFTSEFVEWAQKYGAGAIGRVNGDIELLKRFSANGIPVVVKTWLNIDDDIGHFRVVKGFDESKKVIIQDDSYHGPNKEIPYFDFLSMWQPFNYDYIVVYTPDMEEKVMAIIGDETDDSVNWERALARAEKEKALDSQSVYPAFNVSASAYHLGDYQRSASEFETVEARLPRRMLWYQIEPIRAYQKLKNYERVFAVTDRILNGGNRAFSELYLIRGEIYLAQGEREKARAEFEKALLYNENLETARKALDESF